MRSRQRLMVVGVLGVVVGLVGAVGVGALLGAGRQPVRSIGAVKIGTADVLGVVEKMILSDRYKPAQTAFLTEQSEKLKPLEDELAGMEARAGTLAPGSPDLDALTKQYEQKRSRISAGPGRGAGED